MDKFEARTWVMSGSHHHLRVEQSGVHDGRVFIALHDSEEGGHIDRRTVADLRDWLTDWLEETEVKLPTALGSVVFANDRTYTLVKRGESDTSYAPRYGVGETVWLNVHNGWDSPDSLSRASDLKILFDAGEVDQ